MSRKARAQITITDISDGEQYFIELSQENVVIPSNSTYGQLANCTATFWKKTGNGAKTAASMYCWVYARKGVSLTLISSASNLSQANSSHTFSVNSDYLTTSYDAIVVYIYPTQGGFNPSSQYYAKKEIAITKNGDKGNKGDDGVAYTLTCSPAAVNFRRNAAGEFATAYINVSCEVKKSVGGTISDVTPGSGSGVYLFYRKLTTGSAQAWTQRTSASASQSVSYAEASAATYAVTGLEYALTSNNSAPNNANVLARTTVPVMLDGMNGAPGSTGKAFYSAGQWNDQTKYTANEYECPLVWIDAGSGGREWYYLPEGESTNQNPKQTGTPGNPWKRAQNNWNVILTEALFADFASFQSAVITGDWLISKHGFCEGKAVNDNNATYLDGGVAKPYYLKFDPTDPKGETTTNFKPNFALDLKTGTLYGSKMDISGTIHAENFFHNVCFFREGGFYSSDWWYVSYETDRTIAKGWSVGDYVQSDVDVDGLVHTTYNADVIMCWPTIRNWQDDTKVLLPHPAEFYGKMLMISGFSYGTTEGDIYIGCCEGKNVFSNSAYVDDMGKTQFSNEGDGVTMKTGGFMRLLSVKDELNRLDPRDNYKWVVIENATGGDIYIDGGGVIPSSGVSSVAGLTGSVSDTSLVNAIHDALTNEGFKTTDNNNTYRLTLNGTQKGTPGGADLGSFYAPTAIGSDGQFLKSTGSGAPSWSALPTATTSAAGIVQLGTGAAQAAKGDHTHNFLIPLAGGNVGSASGNNYLWIKRASKTADGTPNNGLVLEYGGSGTWTGQLYFADNGKDGVYFGGWNNGERVAWNKLAFVTDTVANAANATNAGNADTVDGRHASDFLLANGMYTENNGISDFSVNFPQNDNNDSKMDVDFNGGDTYNFDADVFVKYNNSWKEVLHTGTAYIENGAIYIGGNSIKPLTSEQYRGTVTQVKVGSTAYNPSNGVVTLPAYPTKASWNYDDRYQPLITNSTELLVGSLAAAGTIGGSSANFDSLTSENATVTGNLTVKGGGLLLTYPFTKVNGDTQTTPAFKTYWRKIGSYTFTGFGSSQAIIELFSGDGYNGNASQNSNAKITLKHGWQQADSGGNRVAENSVGVICERYGYPCEFQVRVEATGYTTGHVWVLVPVGYGDGFYRVSGHGMAWTHNTAAADTTTDPTHNQRAVTYYDYQKKLTFVDTKNGNGTVDGNSNSFSAICFPFTKSVDGRITLDLSGISANIPTATSSVLGGVKVGDTLAISSGVLNQKSGIATAGTYTKVTVDTYGRVTAGTTLAGSDIPNISATKITSDKLDAARLPDLSGTYVTLSTAQTISGTKTFSQDVTVSKPSNNATFKLVGGTYTIGLHIGAGGINRGIYDFTTGVNKWLLYFDANNTILNNGNVGIGTTSPEKKLHVAGDTLLAGIANVKSQFNMLDASGNTTISMFGTSGQIHATNVYIGGTANNNLAATQGWVISKGYQTNAIETVMLNNTALTVSNKAVNIPIASDQTAGVVYVGNEGVKMDGDHLVIDTAWLGTQGYGESYILSAYSGSGTSNYWRRLGIFKVAESRNLVIDIYSGNGYNGGANQNSWSRIIIKGGWQKTQKIGVDEEGNYNVGITCEQFGYPSQKIQVRVNVTERTNGVSTGHVWVLLPWDYKNGNYRVSGKYTAWTHNTEGTSPTDYPNSNTTDTPPHNQGPVGYFDYLTPAALNNFARISSGTIYIGDNAITPLNSLSVATGTNNGTIKYNVNGGNYTEVAVKGLQALAYKSSLAFTDLSSHPTTLSGYGITDAAAASHTHGSITNDGKISDETVRIGVGDVLLITDNSNSNKIVRSNITFNGSDKTKALTPAGTFETFLTQHQSLANYVTLSTTQEITGAKTFTAAIAPNGGITPITAGSVNTATGGGKLVIKKASVSASVDGTPNNGVVLEYGNSTSWVGQLYMGDNATQGLYWNGWSDGERGEWKKIAFVTDTVANAANATNAGNADTVDGRHASDFLLANGMYTENNGISDFSVNFPQNDNHDSKMDVDFNGGDTYNFDADVFVKYNNSWKEVLHTGTAYIENGTIYIGGNSIKPLTSEQYRGTVTQVKVGSTAYNPSNGVVSLPAYPTKASWNYDDVYLKLSGGTLTGSVTMNSVLNFGSDLNAGIQKSSNDLVIGNSNGNVLINASGLLFNNKQVATINDLPKTQHNATGTNGTAGWVKIANISIGAGWKNQPITFHVTQRRQVGVSYLTLLFTPVNSASTTVQEFVYFGGSLEARVANASLGTTAANSWSLFIKKSEAFDNIGISLVDKGSYMDGVSVTWTNTHYSDANMKYMGDDNVEYYYGILASYSFKATQVEGYLPLTGGGLSGKMTVNYAFSGDNWASDYGAISIRTTAASNPYMIGFAANSDGYGEIQVSQMGVDSKPLVLQKKGGNVGIGTTSPSAKLHVVGDSILYNCGDATMKFYGVTSPVNSSFGKESVAIQTAFDRQDPETSTYPYTYRSRTNLLLQPRGGNVIIGQEGFVAGNDVTVNSEYVHFNARELYIKTASDSQNVRIATINDIANINAAKLEGYKASEIYNAFGLFINATNSANEYIRIATVTLGQSGLQLASFTAIFSPTAFAEKTTFVMHFFIRRETTDATPVYELTLTPMGTVLPPMAYIRQASSTLYYVYIKKVPNVWRDYYKITPLYSVGNITLESTGVASMSGNGGIDASYGGIASGLTLNNSVGIKAKNTGGAENEVLTLNSSNNLVIGWGVRSTSNTFITGKTVQLSNNGGAGIILNENGNVGIGTTSPAYKLDVNGSARVSGNLTVTGTLGGPSAEFDTLTVGGKSVSLEGHTHSQYLTSDDLSSASVYWAEYAGSANSAYSATTADSATSAAKADALKATTINYWSGQNSVEYRLIGQKLMYKTNGKQRGWMTLSIGSRHNGAQIVSIIYGCEQESANFNLANAFCEIEQHGTLENSSADDVLYCHVLADSSNNLQFSFFWRHRDNSPVDIRVIASGGNAVFTPQAYSGTSQNFTESQLSSLISSYGALFSKGQRRIGVLTSYLKSTKSGLGSNGYWGKIWDIALPKSTTAMRKEMVFMVSDPDTGYSGVCILRLKHSYNTTSNKYTFPSVVLEQVYGNVPMAQFRVYYSLVNGKVELWCNLTAYTKYFNFTVLKQTADGAGDDAAVLGFWYPTDIQTSQTLPTVVTNSLAMVEMTRKSVDVAASSLTIAGSIKAQFSAGTLSFSRVNPNDAAPVYSFDGQVTSGSDSRMKNIDKYLEPSVYDIAFAPLVAFRWKNGDSRQNVGTIAQYWEKILPQAVHENSDGFLSLEYSTIALAAGVTASRKAVDNERRIIDLERELAALKVRVAELEQEAA